MTRARGQTLVDWANAPARILAMLGPLGSGESRPAVVGVTGPVGSGKSTLAHRLGGVCIATDRYLPDYLSVPEHERDEPRHADLPLLAAHLRALRRGESVEAPVWSFHTHARAGRQRVAPEPVIVCEGLFALHEGVRAFVDLAVYVEAPRDVRRGRWEAVERSGERGWGVERAMEYFERVAEPTFERYSAEYRALAAIIVTNGCDSNPLEEGGKT